MQPSQYQGLLHLTLGGSAFIILLLGLRLMSLRQNRERRGREDGAKWIGLEPLTIVAVTQETPNIKSFQLRRHLGRAFPQFKGGQFLTLQIGDNPKLTRSYSICSSAANRQTVQIAVRVMEGGQGSGWLHGRKAGDQVLAHPPTGNFTDLELGEAPRVFVAGGIGITPILSMILSQIDGGQCLETHLYYGARTKADLAFHPILKWLSERRPEFKYEPVLSHETGAWDGAKGFIDLAFLKSRLRDLKRPHFLICGPAPMIDGLTESLRAEGVQEEKILSERFLSPASFDRSQVPKRKVAIDFNGEKMAYDGNNTLLEFLEEQGKFLPYACRAGVCGSCKCLIEGDAQSVTDAGLSRQDKLNHYRLACVTFPVSDLRVSLPKSH